MTGKMAKNAHLLDLQTGAVVKLTIANSTLVLGLTATDELISCTEDKVAQSDIVLDLCSIMPAPEGYWFVPSPYLPTSLNDHQVKGHSLLNQGDIISVGDRSLRYSSDEENATPKDASKEKEKQKVQHVSPETVTTREPGRLRDIMNIPVAMSRSFEPSVILDSMLSHAKAFRRPVKPAGPDAELLEFLETRRGLAHMTAAIVSQHLTLHTRITLGSEEANRLFLSFEHVTSWEEACFQTFLCEYEDLFVAKDAIDRPGGSPGGGGSPTGRPLANAYSGVHAPVIHLLTDLLRLTLDPIEFNILWLRVLAGLSECSRSLAALVRHKTAAAVLGCMAAKGDVISVQQQGCHILARVAEYKPAHGEKGPIREGGIQLVVQALQNHLFELDVVSAAIMCLANLLQTYSTLAMETVSSMEFLPLENQRDILVQVMGVLDFIDELAVPVVGNLPEDFLTNDSIRRNVLGILSYFHENMDRYNRCSSIDNIQGLDRKEDIDIIIQPQIGMNPSDIPDPVLVPNEEHNEQDQQHSDVNELSESLASTMIQGVEFFSDEEDQGKERKSIDQTTAENTRSSSSFENDGPNEQQPTSRPAKPPRTFATEVKAPAKKKTNIFDKLKRTKSKPKHSILSTEYRQTSQKDNVELRSSNSLYGGTVQRPDYTSLSLDAEYDTNKHNCSSASSDQSHDDSGDSFPELEPDLAQSNPNLNKHVSRYVNISGRLSKKQRKAKKQKSEKDTILDGFCENPSSENPEKGGVLADFMRRTRRFFQDGKGKYDITEAAMRASMSADDRTMYLPLSLEDHGYNLTDTARRSPDVLY